MLVAGVEPGSSVIVGRRVVRLVCGSDGRLATFAAWEPDVNDGPARVPSPDLMCETGGGALFPPHSLHELVTDRGLFQSLAANGDDLWFYWCARMAGSLVKKVGDSLIVVSWPGTQASSLWSSNEKGGNDRMIRALEEKFGSDVVNCAR